VPGTLTACAAPIRSTKVCSIVCLLGVTLLLCAGLAWKKKRDQAQPGKT